MSMRLTTAGEQMGLRDIMSGPSAVWMVVGGFDEHQQPLVLDRQRVRGNIRKIEGTMHVETEEVVNFPVGAKGVMTYLDVYLEPHDRQPFGWSPMTPPLPVDPPETLRLPPIAIELFLHPRG